MKDQDLSGELNDALRELEEALERAGSAGARIQSLLPNVSRMSAVFDELEAIIDAAKHNGGAPATRPRPTLVVPAAAPKRTKRAQPIAEISPAPETELSDEWRIDVSPPAPDSPATAPDAATSEPLVTFRLELESNPGPLDLRAVDEAVNQHPFVRDVALLDYDGRRATLKVWVSATTTAAEVQESLAARASTLGNGSDVSVVALEDVA
jgi:hypothetical protein